MQFGLMRADKKGDQFELALRAIHQIKKTEFAIRADYELDYERILVASLNSSRKINAHLIDQIRLKQDQKRSKVTAFGFDHAPDITIDKDGTAIELKLIENGDDLRACLGQALVYRFGYRFAIMVLIDRTENQFVVESLRSKGSKEAKMLRDMCDQLNIFTVVGPGPNKKNLAFIPRSLRKVRVVPTSITGPAPDPGAFP